MQEHTGRAVTDLGEIVERDSAELEIKNPLTGAPTGIFIELAGVTHDARHSHQLNAQRELRKRMARIKGANIGKLLADSDPEEEEERVVDYLVACTLGWRELVINGQPVPFSKDAARKLYTDNKRAYVRRQVQEFLEDGENFIGSSPTP